MKKLLSIIVLLMLTTTAFADQVVTINIVPTPTPKPVYRDAEVLPWYRLNRSDVETLAKLLWSSPLYSESAKSDLLWVVFNRVDAGMGTIDEVVNKHEFTWYDHHSRISDKNRGIVEHEMTRWLAQKDGYGIGRRPPRNALYCRFCGLYNRKIELMDDPTGKALEW